MNEAVTSSFALAVHTAALVVAGALTVVALVRRDRLVAGRTVALACASAAVWAGHVVWFEAFGLSRALLLWLPAVGATCGLLWTVARRMTDAAWRPSRAVVALLVAEPLLVAGWQVLLGPHAVVSVGGATVTFGWLFALHTAYCFALLLLTVLALARRSNDRAGAVRLQAAAIQWGAVAALVAEALRLQLTDVAAVVALAVFVGAGVRGASRPVVPPSSERLLDDLGALVLAFDADRRLVEWNRPTELLLALTGRDPAVGDAAADVLGVDLPFADGTVLDVLVAGGTTRLTGFCHALYDAGDGGGWAVVLRRIGRRVPEEAPPVARTPARTALRSLPEHDAETGLLTPLGLVEQLGAHLHDTGPRVDDASARRAVVALVEPGPDHVAQDARALGRWAEEHENPVGVARWTSGRLAVVALAERDPEDAQAIARDVRSAVSAEARIEVLHGDGDLAAVLSLIGEAEGRLTAG
ncbi:hypothetical protein GCM10027215_07670 [Nocardioides zeae]|nr:histidine kinase N-terminal 7TM domain-containing protein [Nocardioides zeae]